MVGAAVGGECGVSGGFVVVVVVVRLGGRGGGGAGAGGTEVPVGFGVMRSGLRNGLREETVAIVVGPWGVIDPKYVINRVTNTCHTTHVNMVK